jgi:hypothetical protein
MTRTHWLTLALLAALPCTAGAQGLRTVELSRPLRDTLPVHVRLEYGAARVALRAADQPLLYDVELTYDPRRADPAFGWNARSRTLRVGLDRVSFESGEARSAPQLDLRLGRQVPLDLQMTMGAGQAELDLTGLRVSHLKLEAGASDAYLHFDAPNAVPLELLDVSAGAAHVRAAGLGQARAREVRVKVGVGRVDLDFGGEWRDDVQLDLEVALGQVTVRVPAEVGVRLAMGRFAASVTHDGLVKRGDEWVSPNWDQAARRITIRGRTAVGGFVLERTQR